MNGVLLRDAGRDLDCLTDRQLHQAPGPKRSGLTSFCAGRHDAPYLPIGPMRRRGKNDASCRSADRPLIPSVACGSN